MPSSVPTIAARAVLEACEAAGIDPAPIRAAAGLDALTLEDSEARISFAAEQAVWAEALRVSADPTLPLRAALRVRGDDYRVLLWLGRHSTSTGEALGRVARWFALVSREARFVVVERPQPALVFEVPGLPPPLPRPVVDYSLAVTWLRMREALGTLPLRRVELPYSEPGDTLAREVFECSPVYGAPRAALVLDREVWERPVPGADAALGRILEEHAALLLERLPPDEGPLVELQRFVAAALPEGAPRVGDAARALGTSARSLQRRLRQEGLTWSGLVDDVRLGMARVHLADPGVSLVEVAFLLGFSDQSAFTRAYRRWTGETPAAARRARPTTR